MEEVDADGRAENLRGRFRGAFLGCMLGDAIGRPFEMMSARDSRLSAGLDKSLEGSGSLRYTDDTEMMISVAESLVRVGGVSRDDLLATLAANYDPARGYGHGMKLALAAVRAGSRPAAFASWSEGSKGSGGAVRIVPIACAYHDDTDLLAAHAEEVAGATHAHRLGRAGGVAHAVAIAHVLGRPDETLDAESLLSDVLRHRAVGETALAPKLESVRALLASSAGSEEAARVLGNGVLSEEAVPLALFAFLRWAPDFTSVVRNTILAGGDTDTTAAMSGALCAALVGERAMPAEWLARVEPGVRGLGHVRSLADSVFEFWWLRSRPPPAAARDFNPSSPSCPV